MYCLLLNSQLMFCVSGPPGSLMAPTNSFIIDVKLIISVIKLNLCSARKVGICLKDEEIDADCQSPKTYLTNVNI